MDKQDIKDLVSLRSDLITQFEKLRDYKNNKNAIMKEVDCARILHNIISRIDNILKGKVEFK